MTDMAAMAATAEKVVEDVMKIEPVIAGAIGMFVPGASPITAAVQPWLLFAAPYLERALEDIAQHKGGDILDAVIELMQHVSKGQPNSVALTPAIPVGMITTG